MAADPNADPFLAGMGTESRADPFVRLGYEAFHDEDSKKRYIEAILKSEFDHLAEDVKAKILKHIGLHDTFESIVKSKLAKEVERERALQDESLSAATKIDLLQKQQDDLNSAETKLLDAKKAMEYAHELFLQTKPSKHAAFSFNAESCSQRLKDRIATAKQRRQNKKIECFRIQRRTPGRKKAISDDLVFKTPRHKEALKQAEEHAAIKRPTLIFDNPKDDKNEGLVWKGVKQFQTGELSKAWLYLGLDKDNKIVKRIVRKDIEMEKHMWRTPYFFRGDLKAGGVAWPLEWLTNNLACTAKGARSILRQLGPWHPHNGKCSFTIYVDYAACGDLSQVIHRYSEDRAAIPTAFIILVFQRLIEACLIMKNGRNSAGPAEKDWNQIVHRGLKPANVFLDLPNPKSFGLYPQPKLGDWGASILTNSEEQSWNAHFYATNTRSTGFTAPEQLAFDDPVSKRAVDDFPLLSPCNVWAVGAIIFSLMHPRLDMPKMQPTFVPGETFGYRLEDHAEDNYPEALCRLVERCLLFEPDSRPTPEDVQREIAELIRDDEYLRRANAGQQDPEKTEHKLKYAEDEKYKIGLVRDAGR